MEREERVRNWFVPLSRGDLSLREARAELASFGLVQKEIPWLVQLIENPRYDLPWIDLFHGATSLDDHDSLHIVLGRGLLPKDEAFVIGFTMGSTDRVSTTEERLYALFAKHLYPRDYRMSDEDIRVFRDACKLGFVSDCRSLASVRFSDFLDCSLGELRRALGIEEELLRAYYAIERRRYPASVESQRLLE